MLASMWKPRPLLAKHSSGIQSWWSAGHGAHSKSITWHQKTLMHLYSAPAHARSWFSVRLREIIGQYLQRSRRISTLHPDRFLQRFNGELMNWAASWTVKGTRPDSALYLRWSRRPGSWSSSPLCERWILCSTASCLWLCCSPAHLQEAARWLKQSGLRS